MKNEKKNLQQQETYKNNTPICYQGTLTSKEEKQSQISLPPLIKRQVPEGHEYIIVIPENVERIIRKYCAKAPDNEWSGTLFYEVEGDFDSPVFKIICRDFYLMDLGSAAFTSFDEDGTAMDYMCQHPELLNCQMGLTHSHDRMSTFFSGTDTSTLQKEGTDRNNFVSLIVNNAGSYTAAITRKVEYKENHNIRIDGKYPFFGTKQVFEVPESNITEEKVKTVVEWFDLKVEKTPVHDIMDEYEERFNEIKNKTTTQKASGSPSWRGYKAFGNLNTGYYTGYRFNDYSDTDSEYDNDFFYKKPTVSTEVKPKTEVLKPSDNKEDKDFYDALLLFDDKLLPLALGTPILVGVFKDLALQIITGCPVISKWVSPLEATEKTFNEILGAFSKDTQYDYKEYSAFIYENLNRTFALIDAEDYFPTQVINSEAYSIYRFEDVLLIKLLQFVHTFEKTYLREAIEESIKEFYNIT